MTDAIDQNKINGVLVMLENNSRENQGENWDKQEERMAEAVNSPVRQREFTRVATSARSLIRDTGILRSPVSYLRICSHGKYVKHLQHDF